ncbi:hypothetical protein FRX31_009694 [Thalictrum thalictroides]|uniref:Uncharacterized protein n=1 Tax=Thalictrum thalictroides TaxID=46969 RepID=A0A7J6WX97_THATH|nr:hypothetical protein FRX31_009694 [Thalictrum thalictroides]
MIGFALLVAPLPVAVAALYSGLQTLDSSSNAEKHKADPSPTETYICIYPTTGEKETATSTKSSQWSELENNTIGFTFSQFVMQGVKC